MGAQVFAQEDQGGVKGADTVESLTETTVLCLLVVRRNIVDIAWCVVVRANRACTEYRIVLSGP